MIQNLEGITSSRLAPHFAQALVRWAAPGLVDEERELVHRIGRALVDELALQNTAVDLDRSRSAWPDAAIVRDVLSRAGLLASSHGDAAPLVMEGQRIWLTRLHRQEVFVADSLRARARHEVPLDADPTTVRARLGALFRDSDRFPENWQRVGAAMALLRALCVVTGGPGTGKTTTVMGLLAVLVEHWPGQRPPRIRLAAPTGKAAARLTESLRASRASMLESGQVDASILSSIPEAAETLHRLLGYRRPRNLWWHGADRPLDADVVVVDEASMVDLRMMAALLAALRPETRLVLLGDKDQLASVEAGSVLGDLCAWSLSPSIGEGAESIPRETDRLSRAAADAIGALTGYDLSRLAGDEVPALADGLCQLIESHRFGDVSRIAHLAAAVNAGQAEQALELLRSGHASLVHLGESTPAEIAQRALLEWNAVLDEMLNERAGPETLLAWVRRFQLLCATRGGPFGVVAFNRALEVRLRERVAVEWSGVDTDAADDRFWPGRPIMVTENDYATGLFNGDVGMVLAGDDGRLHAWFPDAEGKPRAVHVARLPAHESAFALTVHKSQGSEFDSVLVVLPSNPNENESRLLTRELLYTAITRARSSVTVCAPMDVVRRCVDSPTRRVTGLRGRLWIGEPGQIEGQTGE